MATIALCVRETQKNTDGSYTIKVAIGSQSRTTYIATRYKIDNIKQWKDGKVVKHPDADYINRQLRKLLHEYETIYEAMPNPNVSAADIRQYLLSQHNKSDLLKDYAEKYIERLKKENRTSYAKNMEYTLKYLLEKFGENLTLQSITPSTLNIFEDYLMGLGGAKKKGDNAQSASSTTANIRMSHLKALLNAAVNDGIVEYKIFPFRNYKMPAKNVRDISISKSELSMLREAEFTGVSAKRLTVARDLFLLSFYCAGINLTDLMSATLTGDVLTFIRKKTAGKKTGADKEVSITIQPEAREIIDRYINERGELDMGYHYSEYEQFRSFVTKSLNRIGKELGFEKRLTYYSARKTFVQFGSELGIPLYILEYSIGQTIKEANNRPVFDYIRKMRHQADLAIRTIIDYSFEPETEDAAPLPEWARRK
ncbi:MAG: site-specific integrase [Paramuribaculum sp.]|nr:site-specific integrase [Paramuribaculum sp.]